MSSLIFSNSSNSRESLKNSVFIFGGSFDPPHLGHEEAIAEIYKTFSPARIWLMPTFQSKSKTISTSFEHRFQLAEILSAGLQNRLGVKNIQVSSAEKELNTTYTFELLRGLQSRKTEYGEKPTFVIGSDQFQSLPNWGNFPEVLDFCNWLILVRKPDTLSSIATSIEQAKKDGWLTSSRTFQFFETEARAISSSQIRGFIAKKETEKLKMNLNLNVLDYLERNHLYGA